MSICGYWRGGAGLARGSDCDLPSHGRDPPGRAGSRATRPSSPRNAVAPGAPTAAEARRTRVPAARRRGPMTGAPMETPTLGPFTVGRLAIGTMLMGAKTRVEESHRILDRFVEAGGNLVDTADVYSDGGSEETLAPWLRQHRDDVVL